MYMKRPLIVGVLVVFGATIYADEGFARPFGYYHKKGPCRISVKNGNPIYTESVIIVTVPGRVRLCTPEYRECMALTLPIIASEPGAGRRILVSHPKIKGLIPIEDLP